MKQAIDFSKDLVTGFLDKAGKQKDQLVSALSREFVKFLEQINVAEELQKVMDGMTVELTAKIDFKKKDSQVSLKTSRPTPKAKPRPKKKATKAKKKKR